MWQRRNGQAGMTGLLRRPLRVERVKRRVFAILARHALLVIAI